MDDQEPLSVLFALHEKFDIVDFAGPLEAFHSALHELDDPSKSRPGLLRSGIEARVLICISQAPRHLT